MEEVKQKALTEAAGEEKEGKTAAQPDAKAAAQVSKNTDEKFADGSADAAAAEKTDGTAPETAEAKGKKKAASGDMTTGNPWKKLIVFALPILLGGLLQQLYNAVDAAIVKMAVGDDAMGAVSQTASIVQLLIAMFMGLASGATVVVANYFGKKDKENVNKTVHTAMILAVIAGVIFSIIGYFLSPVILGWINTPGDVNTPGSMMHDATQYLQIFFIGMTGLAIYNMGASILQAMGNSRWPLYFLIVSTVLNIVGDLLFTMVFGMGVAGAALATIISEAVSAVLIVVVMMRSKREYKLSFKKLKINGSIMKKVLIIGLPGAIQQSIVSISNVMVTSYINGITPGVTTTYNGYAAASKLDAFLPLPISSMGLAVTPFVSQNLGAGEERRAKKGVWISMILGIGATALLSAIALIFNKAFLSIFASGSAVLDAGWKFMVIIAPFYFLLAGTTILPGALRGAGKVNFSTVTCILSFVVVRQIYLAVVTNMITGTDALITAVALGYPVTWAVCAITILIYYLARGISAEKLSLVKVVRTDGMNRDFVKLCKRLDAFQNKTVPGRRKAGLSNVYNLENLKDIFLMYDGNAVIGSAGLWQHDDKTCEAVHVYVDSSYRGKGLEKMLLDEVGNLAKSLGYSEIHIRTYNSTPAIVNAYETIGFSHVASDDFKYADRYPQALLLAPLRVYMKTNLDMM